MGLARWLGTVVGRVRHDYAVGRGIGGETIVRRTPKWEQAHGTPPPRQQMQDQQRYATSDDVYAAVNRIAEAASTVPFDVQLNGELDSEHDLALLLQRGNPWHGGVGFWIRVYGQLLLSGEVYLVIDRDNPFDRRMPNALWPVPGHLITPLPGDDKQIVRGYKFKPAGAAEREAIMLDPADVVPICLWNPASPLRGLSPLSSLRPALDAELQAKRANAELFANGAMIDGLISVPGITEVQRAQMEDALHSRYTGDGNRHRVGVLAAEASLLPMTLTPRDAEFLALDKLTTQDVAKAYGIPPMFLGDMSDATYSNYETAHRSFWEQGILPKLRLVVGAINVHLATQFGHNIEVAPDLSAVEALRENDKVLADTYTAMVRGGLDRLWSARRVFGDDVPEEAVSELIPTVLQPATAREPVATPGQPPAPPARAAGPLTLKAAASPRLQAARAALLPGAARAVDRAFAAQWKVASSVIDGLDIPTPAKADDYTQQASDDAADSIFRAIAASDAMREAVETVILDGMQGAFRANAEVYGITIDPGRATDVTQQFIRDTAAKKVQWVNETTRGLIRDGIAEAIENGEGLTGARKRIQAAFRGSDEPGQENVYPDRVENIAQTELARAFNYGTLQQFIEAGIEWQEWSYSGNPNSRHGDIDGQVRRVGEPFDVHGHPARYPADESLPISEAARCGCVAYPRETGPEE